MSQLDSLVRQHFPNAVFEDGADLYAGSFPEWTSLAHFNFLLAVEQSFGVRFTVEEMSEMKSLREIRAKLGEPAVEQRSTS
jgi:acyl carrier protein